MSEDYRAAIARALDFPNTPRTLDDAVAAVLAVRDVEMAAKVAETERLRAEVRDLRNAYEVRHPEDEWRVVVGVPLHLDGDLQSSLFQAVSKAVDGWQPEDRDGWDAFVSGYPYSHSEEAERDRLRAELAAKDERIAVLQRSWDKAREANTAWLDGKTVVLPEEWQGAVTNAVYFNYGPEPKLIDQLCELIESWRPATEPAEAGEDEPGGRVMVTVHFVGGPWTGKTAEVDHVAAPVFAVGHEIGNHYWLDTKSDPPTYHWDGTDWEVPDWRQVTCCEAGQLAYPGPCLWHGTDGHPATPATEPAEAARTGTAPAEPYESCVLDSSGHCSRGSHNHDTPPDLRAAKPGCEATTWDRCLLKECDCGGYTAEPRVFRKGDPEPSGINQVKDDGDRRWCRNRGDRFWYLRDIAGPFLMWDELLDRVERLTVVPTEGGKQ